MEHQKKADQGTQLNTVVLGTFDGVHSGHLALLDTARRMGNPVTFYTFKTPPKGAPCLMLPEDREAFLLRNGADTVVLEEFSNVKSLSPEQFVEKILISRLNARAVVCGFNYRFGKNAQGDAKMLGELLSPLSIPLTVVPPIRCIRGEPISSSRIRELLLQGRVEEANQFLPERFYYRLPVVDGKKIGRTIGIPTANQIIPEGLIVPKHGVYATVAFVDGRHYPAVSNIGTRPTVSDGQTTVTCETHLIGFEGDLYGKELIVDFLSYLREEKRFEDLNALKRQIEKDCASSMAILAAEEGGNRE